MSGPVNEDSDELGLDADGKIVDEERVLAALDAMIDGSDELEFDSEGELLEEELALAALDTTRPSEHQRAGGAPASFAWTVLIGGLLGLVAAFQLALADRQMLVNPTAGLSCDINPFIGCSAQIESWQSKLIFGVPNAYFGIAVFAAVVAVGLALLAGARVSAWLWRVMVASALIGFAFQMWFLYQSVSVLERLCPWCMLTWAVVIAVGVQVIARAAQAGHLPLGERVSRALFRERGLITTAIVLVVLVVITVGFWHAWRLLIGF